MGLAYRTDLTERRNTGYVLLFSKWQTAFKRNYMHQQVIYKFGRTLPHHRERLSKTKKTELLRNKIN